MKRLIALLLPFALAACQSPRATPPQNAYQIQGFDANGNPTTTMTYGGTHAGQAQDSGSAKVADTLANKMTADSEFAFVNLTRYAEDQPDVAIETRLENNHKSAATALADAVKAGASGNVVDALSKTVAVAAQEIGDYRRAKASRPKADTAGISITSFMAGPGSHSATALMGEKFGDTLAAKSRANFVENSSTIRTDTSNTNDYRGVNSGLEVFLKMKQIELELKKLDAASKVPTASTTPAKPTEPAPPVGKVEGGVRIVPGPAVGKVAPGVDYSTVFLWKPKNDSQPNNGSILVPAWMGKANVTVNGKPLTWMHTGSSSQDRDKYLTELGGTYGKNVKVEITGPDFGVTLTIPDGGDRFEQVLLDARKEGGTDGDEVEPDDPAPSVPTNSAVRATFDGTLYAFISPDGIRPIEQPEAVDFFHWTGPGFEDTQKIGALRLTAPGFWTTPRPVQDGDFFELKYVNGEKTRPFYPNGNLQIWSNGAFRVPGSSKPATE